MIACNSRKDINFYRKSHRLNLLRLTSKLLDNPTILMPLMALTFIDIPIYRIIQHNMCRYVSLATTLIIPTQLKGIIIERIFLNKVIIGILLESDSCLQKSVETSFS